MEPIEPLIVWTPETLKRFKVIVKMADECKVEQLTFDGRVFVVDYAKYLIEFLEGEFK
jgi:hypothetical protein